MYEITCTTFTNDFCRAVVADAGAGTFEGKAIIETTEAMFAASHGRTSLEKMISTKDTTDRADSWKRKSLKKCGSR